MIDPKTIVETWIKIKGTSEPVSKDSVESPVAVFLDGSVYINPDFIDEIQVTILNYKMNQEFQKC